MFMKKKKTIIIIASIFIIVLGVVFGLNYLSKNLYDYSYVPMTKNISEMASVSSFIAFVEPTGNVENLKVNDHVTFILTEVKVMKVIGGSATEGQNLQILGTKDVPIDISLKVGNYYVVFAQPYEPGVKEAVGSYVCTQACKGVYRIDHNGNIYKYNMDGREEAEGDRIEELRVLLGNKLTELVALINK
jgi:hypothetical protein